MQKLEEIIFDEYLEILPKDTSYYGEFLKAREIEVEFEKQLPAKLKKLYIKVSDANTLLETERLRDLCNFISKFYKNIFK